MSRGYNALILLLLFVSMGLQSVAQQTPALTAAEQEEYMKQAVEMVKYLEGTLNFLGDPLATVQEKEIIINESYSKIFKDDKVQIEDDLDEHRETPINKDVQAYLKDVDFFFHHVRFSFDVQKTDQLVNELGQVYFRVALMRNLNGRTLSNDTISSSKIRFVEINLDPFQKELKIASYYTTKLNEREELRQWWSGMAPEWKTYFGENIMVFDTLPLNKVEALTTDAIITKRWKSVSRNDTFFVMGPDTLKMNMKHLLFGRRPDTLLYINDTRMLMLPDTVVTDLSPVYSALKEVTRITDINISYKQQFTDLEPLIELTALKSIDFSNTPINDLSPLRNLNQLDAIYCSGTQVTSLDPLVYSVKIKEIYCFDTRVADLQPLANYSQLEKLYCFNTGVSSLEAIRGKTTMVALRTNNTHISDISPLQGMSAMRLLDISRTAVSNIDAIASLVSLQILNMDNTNISSIESLSGLKDLSVVQFSNTAVADLDPLSDIASLKKVFCDKTRVNSANAILFMRAKPGTLVVYESEELSVWWNSLPIYWRAILSEHAKTSSNPGAEELHQIIGLEKLDLKGNAYLQSIQPLSRLTNLGYLSLASTEIDDIGPLINLSALREIDLSNTRISNLSPLQNTLGLEVINIEQTRVERLDALNSMARLKVVYADGSRVTPQEVMLLKEKQHQTLIIYQSDALKTWWNGLSEPWQSLLLSNVKLTANPDKMHLQEIADLQEIRIIDDMNFTDLEPLRMLPHLQRLVFKGTMINDLKPIAGLSQLETLEFPSNPIANIQALSGLSKMQTLNMENTAVSDLSAIAGLVNLKVINLSGTQVNSLKPLAGLTNLVDLSVYNTRLKSLSPADQLPALKNIKCYNTRIKAKEIDALKANRPEMNILYY
ncbi:MAG: hypothetical protein KKD74_03855 [Bacteroidetes bacterium]|nr:hypothetical protein [Bacteroidota bacterium]